MKTFYAADLTDKRMSYAKSALENIGYTNVKAIDNADFLLTSPIDQENANNPLAIKYYNDEEFLQKNAQLTAEIAVGIAITETDFSLNGANILILGYGRIAKALCKYLSVFTNSITVCARRENDRALAKCSGANAISFDELKVANDYDIVFNTVPFPVMAERELSAVKPQCVLIELASLPGGIDKHIASLLERKLIIARGIPAKYAPKTAGLLVANAVDKLAREVSV